jgi:hypothetical protein
MIASVIDKLIRSGTIQKKQHSPAIVSNFVKNQSHFIRERRTDSE